MKIFIPTISILILSFSAFAETYTVTRNDDRNDLCLTGVDCSLREAVKSANATSENDTINFNGDLSTITLTNEIVINNNGTLNINGNGANVFAIDGGAGTNRIFYINSSIVTISGATLTGGNAVGEIAPDFGGAIFTLLGSLTLDNVHVKANSAAKNTGGGVYFDRGTNHRILNSTFSANTAYYCGGFYNSAASITISNSTVSGNKSIGIGGGFCSGGNSSNTTLQNVTVTENTSGESGGIYISNLATVIIGNSIIAGNTGNDNKELSLSAGGILSTLGYNIIGNNNSLPGEFSSGSPNSNRDFIGSLNAPVNPLLAPLNMNGGTTPTHALLEGSPAINTGNNQGASATDQRGFTRIMGSAVDIGAYEFALPVKSRKRVRFF